MKFLFLGLNGFRCFFYGFGKVFHLFGDFFTDGLGEIIIGFRHLVHHGGVGCRKLVELFKLLHDGFEVY